MLSIMRGVMQVDALVLATIRGPLTYLLIASPSFHEPQLGVTYTDELPLCSMLTTSGDRIVVTDVATDKQMAFLANHPWLGWQGPAAIGPAMQGIAAVQLQDAPHATVAIALNRGPIEISDERWSMFLTMRSMLGDLDALPAAASTLRLCPWPAEATDHEADASRARDIGMSMSLCG